MGLDFDELVVVLVVAAAILSAVIASIYLIVSAPALLAEMLLDGVLSAALLRRLRKVDRRHWLESAIIRTRFPVFWVALCFVVMGLVFQWYLPDAVSIGDVWHQITHGST